jgi:type I restriction enzyme S subunit
MSAKAAEIPLRRLSEVCERITVGHVGPMVGEYIEDGIPFLRSLNITPFRLSLEGLKFISRDFHHRLRKSGLHPGDVVVVRTGYPGTACVIPDSLPQANCADLVVITPSPDLNPYYLAAQLNSAWGRSVVAGHLVGAAQQHFNIHAARELTIPIPRRALQDRIAEILSAYQDLIQDSLRRMKVLEEMARTLYREWFVALRFPCHERVHIADGVPEGWERKRVDEMTSFLNRGIAPQYDDDADGLVINQKCVRGGRLDLAHARHQSREFRPDRQIQPGDVLVNSTGEGTLGRVAQVLAPVANCTVDTHVTVVRPIAAVGFHYFGQALMEMETRFSTMGRGATNQTELSRSQIGEVEVLVPPTTLVRQFEDFSRPCFRQIATLIERNENLRLTHDLLLPRLMSGQIRLDEAAA